MATPAAAGIALLARQYFMDEKSPDFWVGTCNQNYSYCKSFTPSGVLIKAVLLHSGSAMALFNGGGSKDVPLGIPPDFMQGYGRVNLANVLPLKGVYENFNLFVDDLINVEEGFDVVYKVKVEAATAPLK
jgi:hypothetical protein